MCSYSDYENSSISSETTNSGNDICFMCEGYNENIRKSIINCINSIYYYYKNNYLEKDFEEYVNNIFLVKDIPFLNNFQLNNDTLKIKILLYSFMYHTGVKPNDLELLNKFDKYNNSSINPILGINKKDEQNNALVADFNNFNDILLKKDEKKETLDSNFSEIYKNNINIQEKNDNLILENTKTDNSVVSDISVNENGPKKSEKYNNYYNNENIDTDRSDLILESGNSYGIPIDNLDNVNKTNIEECNSSIIFSNDGPKKENENVKLKKPKIKESTRILKKIKYVFYKYYDNYLPSHEVKNEELIMIYQKINNVFCKVNKSGIETIILYYHIYKCYISMYKEHTKDTFIEFIEYNNNYYSKINYEIDRFFEKVKKCYDFIMYFINNGKNLIWIKNTVFRSGLTYTKLYKIKNEDYDQLLKFFIEKEDIYVNPGDSEYTDNDCYSDPTDSDTDYSEND